MYVETLKSWDAFKSRISERYPGLAYHARQQIYFRGHGNSNWELVPTLDRLRAFDSDSDRDEFLTRLMREFQRNCYGLRIHEEYPRGGSQQEWEYLGRHHALPSTVLDWTESPYVAAYFAFEAVDKKAEHVAVWALDNSRVSWTTAAQEGVQLDSFEDTVRFNIRAAEQRGIAIRITQADTRLQQVLDGALFRFDIPANERQQALADLDEMLINRRTLFRDLDGAARVTAFRVGVES